MMTLGGLGTLPPLDGRNLRKRRSFFRPSNQVIIGGTKGSRKLNNLQNRADRAPKIMPRPRWSALLGAGSRRTNHGPVGYGLKAPPEQGPPGFCFFCLALARMPLRRGPTIYTQHGPNGVGRSIEFFPLGMTFRLSVGAHQRQNRQTPE